MFAVSCGSERDAVSDESDTEEISSGSDRDSVSSRPETTEVSKGSETVWVSGASNSCFSASVVYTMRSFFRGTRRCGGLYRSKSCHVQPASIASCISATSGKIFSKSTPFSVKYTVSSSTDILGRKDKKDTKDKKERKDKKDKKEPAHRIRIARNFNFSEGSYLFSPTYCKFRWCIHRRHCQ